MQEWHWKQMRLGWSCSLSRIRNRQVSGSSPLVGCILSPLFMRLCDFLDFRLFDLAPLLAPQATFANTPSRNLVGPGPGDLL